MNERFCKTGKIEDYLSAKEPKCDKGRKESGAADKNKGTCDKAGQLR